MCWAAKTEWVLRASCFLYPVFMISQTNFGSNFIFTAASMVSVFLPEEIIVKCKFWENNKHKWANCVFVYACLNYSFSKHAGSRLCHLFKHNVTHTHVLSHNFFPFSQTFSSSLSLSHTVHSNCQAWWMRSVPAVSLTVAASDRLPNLPQIKISSLTDWFILIFIYILVRFHQSGFKPLVFLLCPVRHWQTPLTFEGLRMDEIRQVWRQMLGRQIILYGKAEQSLPFLYFPGFDRSINLNGFSFSMRLFSFKRLHFCPPTPLPRCSGWTNLNCKYCL